MVLRTRKPTGAVPWPCLLVEGSEGAGKSWMAAELTASPRVGRSLWLEIGTEGIADEYGSVPGARYEMILHDGTWTDIIGQVEEAHTEARKASEAGEPPMVLVVDNMTAEWEMLSEWADNRARARENKKRARYNRSQMGVDESVTIGMDLWNDAKARHRKLMTYLLTFSGIVVMLAKAGEVAKVEGGRPVEGHRDYKIRGEKDLAFDATGWVRLDRSGPPMIVKLRSVHAGLRPGHDDPRVVPNLGLEWLVFDHMKCDPSTARVREVTVLKPGSEDPLAEEITMFRDLVLDAADEEALRGVWDRIKSADLKSGLTTGVDDVMVTTLGELVAARLSKIRDQGTKDPVVQVGEPL